MNSLYKLGDLVTVCLMMLRIFPHVFGDWNWKIQFCSSGWCRDLVVLQSGNRIFSRCLNFVPVPTSWMHSGFLLLFKTCVIMCEQQIWDSTATCLRVFCAHCILKMFCVLMCSITSVRDRKILHWCLKFLTILEVTLVLFQIGKVVEI